MPVYMVPGVDPKLWGGRKNLVFQGADQGRGIPRYASQPGFPTGSEKPIPVGARYFGPKDERDYDENDEEVPIAVGSKYDGGPVAYQTKVYNAAKKDRVKLGFSRPDVEDLKPRKVA